MKTLLRCVLMLCLLCLLPWPTAAAKDQLYVVHSVSCPPCRQFDEAFRDPAFRAQLQNAFVVRSLSWEDATARERAMQAFNWAREKPILPAFIVTTDSGHLRKVIIGFGGNTQEGRNDLLQRLRLPTSGAQQNSHPQPIEQVNTEPQGETVDHAARDMIDKLEHRTRLIGRDVQGLQVTIDAQKQTLDQLSESIAKGRQDAAAQIEAMQRTQRDVKLLSDRLSESHTSTQAAIVSLSRTVASTLAAGPSTGDPIDISNEIPASSLPPPETPPATPPASNPPTTDPKAAEPPTSTAPGPTLAKWLSVGRWAAQTGLAIAAPEIAIPGSIALSAAGLAITWLRRRQTARQPGVLGSRSNPITLHEPAAVQTETKYVVTESDILGEAYREAVRRVGNSHRERNPAIVDVLKQIDGAATQIAHGSRVSRRLTPASETLP